MTGRLPDPLRASVEAALATLGPQSGSPRRIVSHQPVGGGCIHNGCRIASDDGAVYFLKWNRALPPDMFEAEADGLEALRDGCDLRVPEPLAWSDDNADSFQWLLMEYVAAGTAGPDSAPALGRGVARLHGMDGPDEAGGTEGMDPPTTFGWRRSNWIGSLPQANPETPSWGCFWRDARLRPQLERARSQGRLRDERFDRLLEKTPGALAHVRRAERLHGDLWSGNTFVSREGEPVLIDPAVYRGDGEVDLAMSELFGGFERGFYEAYDTVRSISVEYRSYARDLYQSYYLLVHVNLFGASYEAGTRASADRVLAELG
ncbi:MAG: fructosamine kinase family protein [Gemmatimonadota bacterium]